MRISATGTSSNDFHRVNVGRHSGFTLFEMVVVMLIIGIIVSFTTLTIGGSESRRVQEELARLQNLLALASEEAVLQTEELALEPYRNGYRFLRLAQMDAAFEWQPIEDNPLFRARCLPDEIELAATIEGAESPLERVDCAELTAAPKTDAEKEEQAKEKTKFSLEKDKEPARIFLLSSGEMTPFEFAFTPADRKTVLYLVGELTGKLTTQTRDEHDKKS